MPEETTQLYIRYMYILRRPWGVAFNEAIFKIQHTSPPTNYQDGASRYRRDKQQKEFLNKFLSIQILSLFLLTFIKRKTKKKTCGNFSYYIADDYNTSMAVLSSCLAV